MAGPVLNLTVFTKVLPHTLRAITVITFPPGFLLLLIHGIVSGRVNPAISIIPLFFSSTFGLLLLANEKKCGSQSSGLTGTPIHLAADLLLGVGLLVCLILTWIFLPRTWDGGKIMLGTYCTNFLLVNFLVHLYFVVQEVYLTIIMGAGRQTPSSCPQCAGGGQYGGIADAVRKAARNGYVPLLNGEGEPNEARADDQAAEGAV